MSEVPQMKSMAAVRQAIGDVAGTVAPEATREPTALASVTNPGEAGLQALLGIEAEARTAATRADLLRSLSNAPRRLLGYRQSIVLMAGRGGFLKVEAVTSLASIDRSSPLIRWVETLANRAATETDGLTSDIFQLPAYCDPTDPDTQSFPFKHFRFVPIIAPRPGGAKEQIGIWLCARETPWNAGDMAVAERLAGTYAHAIGALQPARKGLSARSGQSSRKAWWAIRSLSLVVLLLGAFMPVPLSTLAPVEVSASSAQIVAAGMEGIISEVLVDPGDKVAKGDVLVRLDEVDLVNRLDVAERNIEVTQAKLWRANQAAFGSPEAKRELAVARSELRVAQAERQALVAERERAVVRAPAAGLAIFKDKRDLVGKPVGTGERLMQVADPANPDFTIDLPVADIMLLKVGTPVRVFLDSDPLRAVEAQLTRTSYHARPTAEGVLAYRLSATPRNPEEPLRVGARGSAKLIGDDVPLYFYLLRRPIAAVRQWTGW
ncbi:MAG: HlyD family efflux transporter periplasmic adaptor subunit [Pseudomonadota bacterium]